MGITAQTVAHANSQAYTSAFPSKRGGKTSKEIKLNIVCGMVQFSLSCSSWLQECCSASHGMVFRLHGHCNWVVIPVNISKCASLKHSLKQNVFALKMTTTLSSQKSWSACRMLRAQVKVCARIQFTNLQLTSTRLHLIVCERATFLGQAFVRQGWDHQRTSEKAVPSFSCHKFLIPVKTTHKSCIQHKLL